jgi:hypothetical protein
LAKEEIILIKIITFIIICNIYVLNASAEEWDSATFTLSIENPAAYKGNHTLEVLDFDGYGMATLNISRDGIFIGSASLENNDTDWYYMDNGKIRLKSENITDRRVLPMFGSLNSPQAKFTFATQKIPVNPTSLALSISTDKKEYLLNREIIATIEVRNVGETKANDISLRLNSDLLVDGSPTESFNLDDGEKKSLEIKFRFPPMSKASYDINVNASWSDEYGLRYFIEDSQTVQLKFPLEIRKSATGEVKLGKQAYVSLSVENVQTIPLRVTLSDALPVSFTPVNATVTDNKTDLRWEFNLAPEERREFSYQMIPSQVGAHRLPYGLATYMWGEEEYTNSSKTENIILVYKGLLYKEQEFGTIPEATSEPDTTPTSEGSPGNVSPKVIMSATIRPFISVVVTPSGIDFGELAPGDNSPKSDLTIKNSGASNISVTVDVTDSAGNLYVDGIYINDNIWKSFSQAVSKNESKIALVALKVPEAYEGVGSKEGRLMFWAEKSKN